MLDTEDEFTRYVIARLSRTANRDDLIMEVCHKKGLDWATAEAWINQVAEDHSREVARRQAPAFIAICAVAGLSGLGLAASAFQYMIQPFLAYRNGLNEYASLALYAGMLWNFVPQFIGGAAMAAGGVIGLVKLWSKLRYNEPLDS